MRNIVNTYVERFLKERKEQLKLISIIAALAVIVAIGVFWRLHYTGVAMSNEVYCGQEEHTHDESCYEEVLICGLEEAEPVEGHTHSDECYETVTTLICDLEETPGHYHTEECYETIPAQLICGQEETPGHYHDENCYDEEGNLICGQEEYEGHIHSEACWSYEEHILICGQEEYEGHTHTDACYQTDTVLICGLEECEPVEGHAHTEECYEKQLVCGLEEHTHTIECMTDENADLETAGVWEATLPKDLKGIWAEDVVKIAQSQKGYTESTKNFQLAEDGETRKGYTRYGAWYGNEYGDWDAMFASFCLHYAGVPEGQMPQASGSYAWTIALAENGAYKNASDYEPLSGDLIFLDKDGDSLAECVGIVTAVNDNLLTVVEGNYEDKVAENTYGISDANIKGYGKLPEQPGIESETVAETETDTEVQTELKAEFEAETATEAESETKAENGTEINTDSLNSALGGFGVEETEIKIETEAESETEIEKESETESKAETELEDATEGTDVYTILYSSDEPDAIEIDGPESAEEGEDLYFYVTVAEGYELAEVTANEEEIEPEDVSDAGDGEETIYTYVLRNISEDTIIFLDATQVLKGSGSVGVYLRGSENTDPEYTLSVTDVPTNTQISLNSPNLSLIEGDQAIIDITLEGNLYFVAKEDDFEDGQLVTYLMLDDDIDGQEDSFVLTPYGEEDAFDMEEGNLFLDVPDTVEQLEIWSIQTNTLCYLDEANNYEYTQELIGAVAAFEPQIYMVGNRSEGEIINLADLTETNDEGYKFYYGSIDATSIDLTECSQVKVVNGKLLPLDSSGEPVEDYGDVYMAYDEVYSFDVEVSNAVNEFTEDNGDAYLWVGDTFYIDKYHNQGMYIAGDAYTRRYYYYDEDHSGIWVQLGHIREPLINEGEKSFSDYVSVTYTEALAEGVYENNAMIAEKTGDDDDITKKDFGIVGPFEFTEGESDVTTTTVRITGRVGESFTASEVFGTDYVYMINQGSEYHEEWLDVGAHSADDVGNRAWWYWINDVYRLNNYEDICEYIEIYENSEHQIRLEADEIGDDDEKKGLLYDVWDLVGLYTKRESAVQSYMIEHQEDLTKQGIGFFEYPSYPMHVQLRLTNTVEVTVNDVIYNGTLDVVTSEGNQPTLTYDIAYGYRSGNVKVEPVQNFTGRTFTMENSMESNQLAFSDNTIYIPLEIAFDADQTKINITVYATGTLYGTDNSTIVYDENNMLEYSYTLTSEQLKEAWECCPNHCGYDVAVNLGDAVRLDAEKQIVLEKVWDDDSNASGARDNVSEVVVALERSKDGNDWETVKDEYDKTRAFAIRGDSSSDVWSLILTNSDLDLTYVDENEETQDYYFRISEEQEINGVKDVFRYTYVVGYEGNDLVVINSLTEYPISITGNKSWIDDNGDPLDESLIPDSIVFGLYQNDEFYEMTEVTKANNWSFTFTDLPQQILEDGSLKYEYTLYELAEDGTRVESGGLISLGDWIYQVIIEGSTSDSDEPDDDEDVDYKISNMLIITPELPNAGGPGTIPYTLAGLLLIISTAYLLYKNKKRNPSIM